MKTIAGDVSRLVFPGFVLLMLGACGSSGSGYTAASPPAPPGPETAPAPTEPFSMYPQTLGVSSGGNTYAGTYTETPNEGTTMFEGQEANSSAVLLTISENGSPLITEIETAYYLENPYQPLGLTLSYNGEQYDFVYNSTYALPATLTAGGSGPLGSGTFYAAGTNNAIGALTESYSVASSNWMLLNINATGTVNGQSINQTISYVLVGNAVNGVASVDIVVNGTTLHFDSACEGCWDY